MSQGKRFTAWLSDAEREHLEDEARRLGTTMNFVMRLAVRQYFELETPRYDRAAQLDPAVTGVTRNK